VSCNTRDGNQVAEMMRQALQKWSQPEDQSAEKAPPGYDHHAKNGMEYIQKMAWY
jgi:hypothetical protein